MKPINQIINFDNTTKNLVKHEKGIFSRRKSESFSWGSLEQCKLVLKNGFKYCDDSVTDKSFMLTPELTEVAEWMTNTNGSGLALIGRSGGGKTLFLHGVLPHLLMSKKKVSKCIKAIDMNFEKANYVLIDEVGREGDVFINGKGKVDRFPVYVDHCADFNKPLFFTSNIESGQFVDRYGEYIYNRVLKKCRVIVFNGESMWNK